MPSNKPPKDDEEPATPSEERARDEAAREKRPAPSGVRPDAEDFLAPD